MKKWTGFLIVLAIMLLGAYYVMGWMAMRTLSQNITALPQSPVFSVSLEKYQRGWFSSHALLHLKLNIPPQATKGADGGEQSGLPVTMRLGFPLLIQHGPVIFTDTGLRFGTAQVTTRPATHYGALINYLNKTIMTYTLPSMTLYTDINPAQGSYQFNWKGLRLWLGLSSHLNGFESHLKAGGLTISARDFNLRLQKIVSETESTRYQSWLWVGKTHLFLPSLTFHATGRKWFDLKGFDLTVKSQVEDDSLRFDWQFSLQKLFANDQTYGPVTLKLSIRHVDTAAMAKINQQLWNSSVQSRSSLAMMAIMAELPNLLAKGPVIELEAFDLTMPEGKVMGHFNVIFPKVNPKDDAEFMKKIRGEGQFKAPVKVVRALLIESLKRHAPPAAPAAPRDEALTLEAANPVPANNTLDIEQQADKILQDYISKGILKLEGEDYVVTFTLENQQLLVNGQRFNP
ncbi:YdgA family protein [Legionella erythra]|uniref:Putative virulence protein n=1 Tax=Legionella erythra TaxID=448 RepID=A0A0W0TUR7_LEGER|nr:YdgA family protein [Legionella erythra]KTC99189.1 putative virulence protein [Legionella erythra]